MFVKYGTPVAGTGYLLGHPADSSPRCSLTDSSWFFLQFEKAKKWRFFKDCKNIRFWNSIQFAELL